jgi:hydroxymethylglutaryl-CoA lyase
MADAQEVLQGITRVPGVSYPVLVPNAKGMETALKLGVEEIAVFGAASEAFT